jgi:glycosyltransferase 2 family protein
MTIGPLRIPRWLKVAYVGVVAAMLAWVLVSSGPALLQWSDLLSSPGPYVFIATWIGMAAVLGACWAWMLRLSLGLRLPARDWLHLQAIAWSGRYLPGKVGLLAGKASVAERDGVGWRGLGYSVLFEQTAFVASGLLAALLLLETPGWLPEPWLPSWLAPLWTPVRLTAAALGITMFVFGSAWLGRRMQAAGSLSASQSAGLLLLYLVPHALVGAGAFMVLAEVVPDAATLGVARMVGVLALAHAAGVLAIFAPAGLGVREAVLAAGLAPVLPWPEALAFAALLRLLSVVADAIVLLLGLGLHARHRSG